MVSQCLNKLLTALLRSHQMVVVLTHDEMATSSLIGLFILLLVDQATEVVQLPPRTGLVSMIQGAFNCEVKDCRKGYVELGHLSPDDWLAF